MSTIILFFEVLFEKAQESDAAYGVAMFLLGVAVGIMCTGAIAG